MDGDDVVDALAEQHAELDSMISGLSGQDWGKPSQCEGWTISDVLLHLVQTDEMALASLEGRFAEYVQKVSEGLPPPKDLDDSVAMLVERHRGAPGDAIAEQWRDGAARLRKAFAEADPRARVDWVVGTLAARTLCTTRLAECWIHTGDVAVGLGVPHPPADRLWHIVRLAWRTLPHAFQREGKEPPGPVALRLTSPSGQPWDFGDDDAPTVIRGDAADLCRVASRRVAPADTGLQATGPDAAETLRLIRTWA